MTRLRTPTPAEVAAVQAKAKGASDDAQVQDNHLFHLLFSREVGLYGDRPGAKRLRRREWIERYFRIRTKKGEIVPLVLNHAQRQLEATILRIERAKKPVRIQILKARKEGISTYIGALAMERGLRGTYFRSLIVAHKNDAAKTLLDMVNIARQQMPKGSKGNAPWDFKMRSTARASLSWEGPMHTEMTITSAEAENPARGSTPSLVHLCLAPGTPVLVDDGRVVSVEDMQPGARVLTHRGNTTTVRTVTGRRPTAENGAGAAVRIQPWLGVAITLTPNHPVYTDIGWVPASNLTLDRRLSMPIRAITEEITESRLPEWETRHRYRGGRRSKGSGAAITLTEEVGFAVGYYLAEGSLCRNPLGPSAVSFARHRREVEYGKRAVAALSPYATSSRTDQKPRCLTDVDTVYGSPLARWIEREFGSVDAKRIPDWVFRAGVGFARGILAGYLSGDGSKTVGKTGKYTTHGISVTSIRASLVTQARDLAASLGLGWGSIRFKPGGLLWGRNCKDAWVVLWNGSAARSLRQLIGLPVEPGNGRRHIEKYECVGDRVWFRIRSLESVAVEHVYDVEVEHDDHSFRTLGFSVKNSESAYYPKAEEKAPAILAALPPVPGTYGFEESTANGAQGKFHDDFWAAWRAVPANIEDRENPWLALFFPWWGNTDNRYSEAWGGGRQAAKERTDAIMASLDTEERWLLRKKYLRRWRSTDEWERVDVHECEELKMSGGKIVGFWRSQTPGRRKWRRKGVGWQNVDVDQLLWRRTMIADKTFSGDIARFNQENPSRPELAFTSSGNPVFDATEVSKRLESAQARKPLFRGILVAPGFAPATLRDILNEHEEAGDSPA